MKFDGRDIKVVWVDLDDTIVDFLTNSRAALHRLWATERIISDHFADSESWTETYERHNHRLWELYSAGEVTRAHLRIERFRRPLAEGGISEADALEKARIYDTLYLDYLADERALIPGAVELLQALHSMGVTVGCLSNGFKEVQFRKIRNCGLEPLIDLTVLSDEIDITKPDRRIFEYAAARSGYPDPSCHLMIGDNAVTDIGGALGAGWSAIQFLRKPTNMRNSDCRHIFDTLPAITRLLTSPNYTL